jgi:predicted site-specific integrase-resolvase
VNETGEGGPVQEEKLLLVGEVAALFRVDPKTVGRWAAAGKLTAILAPGWRYRRYRESEVQALIDGSGTGPDGSA